MKQRRSLMALKVARTMTRAKGFGSNWHRQKLRDYIANPGAQDNLGKLGKGNDAAEIGWRIESLTKQIAMWERELAKCEAQNGRN